MPYTEACVKEALRMYPPATVLGRQLTQDTTIMGHFVPKGTGVFVSSLNGHAPSIKLSDLIALYVQHACAGQPEDFHCA